MSYSTFGTSKFNCYRSENQELPLLERKKPEESLFVINGLKTFTFKEIKLRGIEACIGDIRRLIKAGQVGKVYQDTFHNVDDQYFTENDYGMLSAYFDQFMKEVYSILHPKLEPAKSTTNLTPPERKKVLSQKKIDLKKQIEELQKDLKETEKEAANIDVEAINSDIEGKETYKNSPEVPIS
jgi:hypothetical protein